VILARLEALCRLKRMRRVFDYCHLPHLTSSADITTSCFCFKVLPCLS